MVPRLDRPGLFDQLSEHLPLAAVDRYAGLVLDLVKATNGCSKEAVAKMEVSS